MEEEKIELEKMAIEQKKKGREKIREALIKDKRKRRQVLKVKIAGVVSLILIFGVLTSYLILKINAWSNKNVIRIQNPLVFQKPMWVEQRKELIVISPLVEKADGVKIDNPIEKKILELWGERYFLLMTAIFKCESGLKPEAVNWTTKDLGVAQINWPSWEKAIKDKFGYTLKDMFDVDKNLEVAHWIWDRADGTEGDGKGSAKAWVVYQNGSFVGCVE